MCLLKERYLFIYLCMALEKLILNTVSDLHKDPAAICFCFSKWSLYVVQEIANKLPIFVVIVFIPPLPPLVLVYSYRAIIQTQYLNSF